MSKPIENCPQPETPIRDRAWTAEQVEKEANELARYVNAPLAAIAMLRAYAATLRQQAEQPEDSRCPATYRREGAVKTLIGLGWKWDGQQWQPEQAGGVVSDEACAMLRSKLPLGCAGMVGNDEARAALEAVAPLLHAPAEQDGSMDDIWWQEFIHLVDDVAAGDSPQREILIEHVAGLTIARVALAQNAQVEAKAWGEGYHQGVEDERTSEANIGIAGFDAKVEPARVNPYERHAERARVPADMVLIEREFIENADAALGLSTVDGEHWTEHESPRFELRKALGLPYEKAAAPSQSEAKDRE